MKKVLSFLALFIVIAITTFSCKTDKSPDSDVLEDNKSLTIENEFIVLTGEFIHVDTAAVLKVENKLYGVKIDDMAKSVIEKAESIKTDDYDVINVDIQAEINPNTESEGWEEIVTIKTLEKIYKPEPIQETKVLKYSSNKTE